MNRGDIYMVSLDPTLGHEQRGQRPVLVISPTEFNEATKLPVILPITSGGEFARRIGFAVPLSGIQTTGVVRCDQPRVLDLRARGGRKVDTLPAEILEEVLAKTVTLFEKSVLDASANSNLGAPSLNRSLIQGWESMNSNLHCKHSNRKRFSP